MPVVVELRTDGVADLRAFRVSLSRVPALHEVVRVLWTVNGLTTAFAFQVCHVVHNANTEQYPRRDGELDAWVHGVTVPD